MWNCWVGIFPSYHGHSLFLCLVCSWPQVSSFNHHLHLLPFVPLKLRVEDLLSSVLWHKNNFPKVDPMFLFVLEVPEIYLLCFSKCGRCWVGWSMFGSVV